VCVYVRYLYVFLEKFIIIISSAIHEKTQDIKKTVKPTQTPIPHKIHIYTQTRDIKRHKKTVKPTQTAISHKIHTYTQTLDINRT